MALPEPTPDAREHSNRVAEHIRGEITASGGWISFARYMELALYAPGLGYYSAGARKLGKAGDFVTAPEISPLYGQTLARQVKQVLEAGFDEVLEVGAGSGALAATLLEELERSGRVPRNYLILELSADLRERSRDTLAARVPHLLERVAWLNRLPPVFSGVVLGNEVLDAMPAHVVRVQGAKVEEGGVGVRNDRLDWSWRLASGRPLRASYARSQACWKKASRFSSITAFPKRSITIRSAGMGRSCAITATTPTPIRSSSLDCRTLPATSISAPLPGPRARAGWKSPATPVRRSSSSIAALPRLCRARRRRTARSSFPSPTRRTA